MTGTGHGGSSDRALGAEHQRRLLIVLGLTLLYAAAEVAGGVATHALALVADAGHMLTDALGLGMALLAIRFARRPATSGKTFGFYRIEILSAFGNALLLLLVAAYILVEAWQRLAQPQAVQAFPVLLVATGGLVVTLVGVRLLHAGSEASLNVKGAFLEVLGDMVGAIGTMLAAATILLTGWYVVDPLISVVIALLILLRAWGLLRDVTDVLLEATPRGMDLDEMRGALCAVPNVQSVHDLHVWTITSGFVSMSGHIRAGGRPSAEVLHDVLAVLARRFGIKHATLQVEATDHGDEGSCCEIDPRCLPVAHPR